MDPFIKVPKPAAFTRQAYVAGQKPMHGRRCEMKEVWGKPRASADAPPDMLPLNPPGKRPPPTPTPTPALPCPALSTAVAPKASTAAAPQASTAVAPKATPPTVAKAEPAATKPAAAAPAKPRPPPPPCETSAQAKPAAPAKPSAPVSWESPVPKPTAPAKHSVPPAPSKSETSAPAKPAAPAKPSAPPPPSPQGQSDATAKVMSPPGNADSGPSALLLASVLLRSLGRGREFRDWVFRLRLGAADFWACQG